MTKLKAHIHVKIGKIIKCTLLFILPPGRQIRFTAPTWCISHFPTRTGGIIALLDNYPRGNCGTTRITVETSDRK